MSICRLFGDDDTLYDNNLFVFPIIVPVFSVIFININLNYWLYTDISAFFIPKISKYKKSFYFNDNNTVDNYFINKLFEFISHDNYVVFNRFNKPK